MSSEEKNDQLSVRIYQMIGAYVHYKTEEKSGKKWEDFKNTKDEKKRILYPKEYRDALEKICSDAFLAMRGRREKDFIEYFVGTICSVPHFIKNDEYVDITKFLMSEWEDVKILSMMAISAHSYVWTPKSNDKEKK